MPQTMLISVVLPAPFGPSSAKISPRADLQVDALQRLEPGRIGLREVEMEMMGCTGTGGHKPDL